MKRRDKFEVFEKTLIEKLIKETPYLLRGERLQQISWAFLVIEGNEKEFWLGYDSISWEEGEIQVTMMDYVNHRIFSASYVNKEGNLTEDIINITKNYKESYSLWLKTIQNSI